MRTLFRTTARVALLIPFGLLFAGSAFAVTITSASNMTDAYNTQPGATTNIVVGTADDPPYCPGTMLLIRGTGFANDGGIVSVMIANVPAVKVTVGSDTVLYAQVGAGATTGPVVVTTAAGTATTRDLPGGRLSPAGTSPSAQLPDYQILPCVGKPTIVKATVTSIKPNPVKGGKKVFINGSGFLGTTSVMIGGKSATFAVSHDNGIVVIVPTTAASGKLTVTITNSAGTTTSTVKLVKKA
jgi:hypothetical protein